MYRQGLGDCFLISLKRSKDATDYKILIDCGVILGTADPATIMTKVVDDIVATTGGKVDLLLTTHEHWDHLSGFIQAAESFKRLTVGEVWLAWTEDPADPLATELRGERNRAMAALQMAANTLRMTDSRSLGPDGIAATDIISDMLGFFGAAGSGTTSDALDKVKAMGPVRYCRPKDAPIELGDPSARLFVLGPPPDAKLIRRTLPSKNSPETYGLAMDGDGVMPADVHKALASVDDDLPFSPMYAIPTDIARGMEFYAGTTGVRATRRPRGDRSIPTGSTALPSSLSPSTVPPTIRAWCSRSSLPAATSCCSSPTLRSGIGNPGTTSLGRSMARPSPDRIFCPARSFTRSAITAATMRRSRRTDWS
jgi:hypothetical protein